MASAVAAAAARPSQAIKVRASVSTTRKVDFLKICLMWRDVPKMKALWCGPQCKHELSHNSGTNISTRPHVPQTQLQTCSVAMSFAPATRHVSYEAALKHHLQAAKQVLSSCGKIVLPPDHLGNLKDFREELLEQEKQGSSSFLFLRVRG